MLCLIAAKDIVDDQLVQMAIRPAHRDLDDPVELQWAWLNALKYQWKKDRVGATSASPARFLIPLSVHP